MNLRKRYQASAIVLLFVLSCGVGSFVADAQTPKATNQNTTRLTRLTDSAPELLPNSSFEDDAKGWGLQHAVILTALNGAGKLVQLNAVKGGSGESSHIGAKVSNIPVNKKLEFRCHLKGTNDQVCLKVNAFAYDAKGRMIQNWSSEAPANDADWSEFSTSFTVPSDTNAFSIWVINASGKNAFFCRPSLKLSSDQKRRAGQHLTNSDFQSRGQKARVLSVHYKTCVKSLFPSESGTVTFPIPGLYREQIPLSLDVSTDPSSALLGYVVKRREDKLNWVCEVRLKTSLEPVLIKWESRVLVAGRADTRPPSVSLSAPNIVSPWRRGSLCVQSDDRDIKAKALQLSAGTDDLETYVRRVIRFTKMNKGNGTVFDALDAKKALASGGSCTSRANLAAALMRARGIPARTMSHLPTWYGAEMFEHWLVEYWHPGAGWIWVESTLGQYQPAPNTLVVLAVSSIEDENKCEDPVHLRAIMHGAPYLSGRELSVELFPSSKGSESSQQANTVDDCGEIKGTSAELAELKRSALLTFNRITNQTGLNSQSSARTRGIDSAVHEGTAKTLTDALKRGL